MSTINTIVFGLLYKVNSQPYKEHRRENISVVCIVDYVKASYSIILYSILRIQNLKLHVHNCSYRYN